VLRRRSTRKTAPRRKKTALPPFQALVRLRLGNGAVPCYTRFANVEFATGVPDRSRYGLFSAPRSIETISFQLTM
jgi:hypothetical protein